MKDKQWKSMSFKERGEYLLNSEFQIKKLSGIPADSIVGDINVVTIYQGKSGGVIVTKQCDTLIECLENAAVNLKRWEEELQ